jgi:hypothetical protein
MKKIYKLKRETSIPSLPTHAQRKMQETRRKRCMSCTTCNLLFILFLESLRLTRKLGGEMTHCKVTNKIFNGTLCLATENLHTDNMAMLVRGNLIKVGKVKSLIIVSY